MTGADLGAYRRMSRLRDGYFAVVTVAVALAVLADPQVPAPRRAGSVAAGVAVTLLYAGFSRRTGRVQRLTPAVLAVVLAQAVLFAVAVALGPASAYLLFAVVPMIFLSLPLRPAAPLVLLLNVVPFGVAAAQDGLSARLATHELPIAAVSGAFSMWLGFWVTRVIEQSIERAALIDELRESRAQVQRLSHESGVAAERARLAGEIHDTLAQGFTSIVTLLQAADPELRDERLTLAVRTARENLAESRAMIAALTPPALGSDSLPEAVRRQAARFAEETGVPAGCRVTGEPRPLPTAAEVVLLRAAQEALANVRRHAGAHEVAVLLAYTAAAVRLVIRDDGCGFDPGSVGPGPVGPGAADAGPVGPGRARGLRFGRDAGPGRSGGRPAHRAQRPRHRYDRRAGGARVIRILLVDDHPVVRHGLRGMLDAEPDLSVVGEASGGDDGLRMAGELTPDLVLMDLRMPGGDGVEATGRILARHPAMRVMVLTTYESDRDILRAIEAGACGYLLKDASPAELADAVRAAARGETVLSPSVASTLVRQVRSPAPPALSAREVQVLRLVARGRTNAEIGRELFIAEATVKTHLLRVFNKLDVADRTAAVTTAMSHGLL